MKIEPFTEDILQYEFKRIFGGVIKRELIQLYDKLNDFPQSLLSLIIQRVEFIAQSRYGKKKQDKNDALKNYFIQYLGKVNNIYSDEDFAGFWLNFVRHQLMHSGDTYGRIIALSDKLKDYHLKKLDINSKWPAVGIHFLTFINEINLSIDIFMEEVDNNESLKSEVFDNMEKSFNFSTMRNPDIVNKLNIDTIKISATEFIEYFASGDFKVYSSSNTE